MVPVVNFGGYELTATQLFTGLGIYLLISALSLYFLPIYAVPKTAEVTNLSTTGTLLDLRSKVRQTVLQFLGGVAVISTFILAIQQIRQGEDTFKQKKADLYSGSMSVLLDDATTPNKRIEAMYVLSFISRSDPSYHRAVFDALANYIRSRSKSICIQTGGVIRETIRNDPQIQTAVRILGERNPTHDPKGKRFNIEHACLTDVDMRDEQGVIAGLRKARLSNAIILRSDFTNADLTEAELMGVWASDYFNPDWQVSDGTQVYQAADGDPRFGRDYLNGDRRRQLVAHFVGATLVNANFEGARLAGADFSWADVAGANFRYANIARVNFVNAKNLHPDQFKETCVGRPDHPQEWDDQQPYFNEADRKLIGKIRLCY